MAECYIQNEDETAPVRCDNCAWEGVASSLEMVTDIQERICPGYTVPAGQCPDCGALAYLKTPPKHSAAFKAESCDGLVAVLQEAIDAWPQFDPNHPRHDEEVNGGDMVEWFGGFLEKVRAAHAGVAAQAAPALPIAVVMEGGLLSAVLTHDRALIGRDVILIDYDAEGSDEADRFQVKQCNGTLADAVGHIDAVDRPGIDLQAVYETLMARGRDLRATGTPASA